MRLKVRGFYGNPSVITWKLIRKLTSIKSWMVLCFICSGWRDCCWSFCRCYSSPWCSSSKTRRRAARWKESGAAAGKGSATYSAATATVDADPTATLLRSRSLCQAGVAVSEPTPHGGRGQLWSSTPSTRTVTDSSTTKRPWRTSRRTAGTGRSWGLRGNGGSIWMLTRTASLLPASLTLPWTTLILQMKLDSCDRLMTS